MDSTKGLIQQKTEKVTLVFDYFSELIKVKIIYTTNIFLDLTASLNPVTSTPVICCQN